ncbi:MAG TPA: hypothetical protein VK832_22225 [Burkholderiaceae bacterium]|nr:hypothetical protein [Burkholderiaceae bacterium]
MKISIITLSALTAAVFLSACTSTGNTTSPATQTPAQVAAQICPPIQTALSGLNALTGLPAGAKADLDTVTPLVAGVCATGESVNLASLQSLQQTALPAIINAVKASGMAVEQQNSVILDITAAQVVLTAVMQARE